MELKETVDMMLSGDYRERFKAEYYQTKIRYEKLKDFNTKIAAARAYNKHPEKDIEKAVPMPKHDCSDELLRDQETAMRRYLKCMEIRAVMEKIIL